MLGDRLASCGDPVLKKQSQICYICSGNLNKTIEASDAGIQETVELVMIMQKALELQGVKDIPIDGNIASVLSNYAEILSAEGNLEAALSYLGNSQEARITMLRDRLCRALGYVQQATQQPTPRASLTQNYYDKGSVRKPYQNTYAQPAAITPMQNWNTAPTKNAYPSGMMNQLNAQQTPNIGAPPIQQQPTGQDQYSAMNTYGQISQVQAPPPLPTTGTSLGGSRPSSVGPQSRSKYILDPSVKSTPTYGGAYQQAAPVYNPVAPVPGYPTQNSYQQSQMPGYPAQGQNSIYNPLETDGFKNSTANIMNPMMGQAGQAQSQMYDPMQSQPIQQTQSYGNDNVYQAPPQPSGWNDPPVGKASRAQVQLQELRSFFRYK